MRAEGPLGFKRVEVAGSRSRVAPILEVDLVGGRDTLVVIPAEERMCEVDFGIARRAAGFRPRRAPGYHVPLSVSVRRQHRSGGGCTPDRTPGRRGSTSSAATPDVRERPRTLLVAAERSLRLPSWAITETTAGQTGNAGSEFYALRPVARSARASSRQ